MMVRPAMTAALLSVLLVDCADTPPAGVTHDPTSPATGPRATWEAAGIDTYTITVERGCYCPDLGPYVVRVVDGEVMSVRSEGEEVPLDDETIQGWPLTVDALFDEVERAERQADDLDVRYDGRLGYPVTIAIDRWEKAIDDEVSYRVTNLEVASDA